MLLAEQTPGRTPRYVAIKFMRSRTQYENELLAREGVSPKYVMRIIATSLEHDKCVCDDDAVLFLLWSVNDFHWLPHLRARGKILGSSYLYIYIYIYI